MLIYEKFPSCNVSHHPACQVDVCSVGLFHEVKKTQFPWITGVKSRRQPAIGAISVWIIPSVDYLVYVVVGVGCCSRQPRGGSLWYNNIAAEWPPFATVWVASNLARKTRMKKIVGRQINESKNNSKRINSSIELHIGYCY